MKSRLRSIATICGIYDTFKYSNAARSTVSWRLIELARGAWARILLAVLIGLGVTLINVAQLSITGYAIGQMFAGAEVSVVLPLLLIAAGAGLGAALAIITGVGEFAGGVGSEVVGAIPNDPLIAASEIYGKTVIEYMPDSIIADRFRELAGAILENGSGITPQPLSKERLAELARRIREKTREAADKSR